jgi:hypothetical protein
MLTRHMNNLHRMNHLSPALNTFQYLKGETANSVQIPTRVKALTSGDGLESKCLGSGKTFEERLLEYIVLYWYSSHRK